MITVWGDKREGSWQTIDPEEDFSPNVAYQFKYILPEKPWWAYLVPFVPWPVPPTWLRDTVVRAIASEAKIPKEEVEVLWFSYNTEENTFQIQIRWVPAADEYIGIPVLIPLTLIISAIAVPLSLFLIGRTISNLAPETVEILAEETRKGIMWLTIMTGLAVGGGLIYLFATRIKKA